MDGLRFRRATDLDIEDCIAIDAATDAQFVEAGHPELAGDGDYIPADVAHRAVADGRILVADDDGDIVAWSFITRLDDELCLGQIAVLPSRQRSGVGSSLLQRILDDASAAGEPSIVLSTQRDLAWNLPWYRRFGFTVVPEANWSGEMASVAADQRADGLDWDGTRVYMRLVLGAVS
ncbi:MAG: GNAT family N-acetyltransferase [Actinomycetota bacterium]